MLISSFLSRSFLCVTIHHEANAGQDDEDKGQKEELRHHDILCCGIADMLPTPTPPIRTILVGDKRASSIDFAFLIEKAREVRRKSERANKIISEITLLSRGWALDTVSYEEYDMRRRRRRCNYTLFLGKMQ